MTYTNRDSIVTLDVSVIITLNRSFVWLTTLFFKSAYSKLSSLQNPLSSSEDGVTKFKVSCV